MHRQPPEVDNCQFMQRGLARLIRTRLGQPTLLGSLCRISSPFSWYIQHFLQTCADPDSCPVQSVVVWRLTYGSGRDRDTTDPRPSSPTPLPQNNCLNRANPRFFPTSFLFCDDCYHLRHVSRTLQRHASQTLTIINWFAARPTLFSTFLSATLCLASHITI